MKKYFVIRLAYDDGFWSEEKQDFVGWLGAERFHFDPRESECDLVPRSRNALLLAASKKPVTVMEVYENE